MANPIEARKLAGKVALVTGGSRGIGRSIALELAAEGADVGIIYLRNEDAAEKTAQKIRKIGRRVLLFRIDLKNTAEIQEVFKDLEKKYGQLDILVHCAALGIFKPVLDLTPTQLRRVFDINVCAFVSCVQEACRIMRKDGSIVALSSLGAQRYARDYGALGIAKASLEAAVRYLAVELAPKGIRVNCVSGGPVDTDSLRAYPEYKRGLKLALESTPAGRIATPEDIAEIVLFLCTRESQWIRGQTIIADGGLSLRVVSL